jgi:methionine-rich copper-binding protein CopC
MRTKIFIFLLMALVMQSATQAHAFLDHAEPKVGSTGDPPTEVKIWFTEEVEPAFSTIQVMDANGKQIDKKDTHLDEKDKTLLIVSVPKDLPAGEYKVVWSVVARDTHHTHGDFKFTVKGKG